MYAITADKAATASLANPMATPTAKIKARFPKIAPAPAFRNGTKYWFRNPPTADPRCKSFSKSSNPIPCRIPAAGKVATGSISDLPNFCRKPNIKYHPFDSIVVMLYQLITLKPL
ncbi:hypothetical protein D3C71_1850550 [compost metagenome]